MSKKDYVTVDDTSYESDDSYDDRDDFPSMFMKLLSKINFKVAIFIFVLGIFLFSDLFVRNVLVHFSGAVSDLSFPTSHGTIIQLTFLVIGYLFIDILAQGKCI